MKSLIKFLKKFTVFHAIRYIFHRTKRLKVYLLRPKIHLVAISEKEAITVCIPAYRSSEFLDQAINSLNAQMLKHFRILISVDGNDTRTWQRACTLIRKGRDRVILQSNRLGWVDNTNWLLSNVETPFLAILPHDDYYHPYYLELLYSHLKKNSDCVLAYSDTGALIQGKPFPRFYFTQKSLKGNLEKRLNQFLLNHFDAVGFRCVARTKEVLSSGLMKRNSFDDFAVDIVWLGKMARLGELHRVPYLLCMKRYHPSNTHMGWFEKKENERRLSWKLHCEDLLKIFSEDLDDPVFRSQLVKSCEQRFLKGCRSFGFKNL